MAAGLVTLAWPGVTALMLLYFIAARALITGAMDVIGAVRLRKEIDGEWLLILNGIASLIFGLIALSWPGATALAVIWLIAVHAVVGGILLWVLSFRMRDWRKGLEARGPRWPELVGTAYKRCTSVCI